MKSTLGKISNMVVTHADPTAAASEAFRVLRTNLQFVGLDKPLKSIVVTSATPGEGKSTTAANLAVAFAQAGGSVCLIDADLRRPTIAKLFGLSNWSGLTNALVGQDDLSTYLMDSAISGLSILPSGPIPPNPAELLGSGRMSKLLAHAEEKFDMVVVDTPPVLAVTDAAVLAPKVGGVVLVVRAGKVARRQASQARDALAVVKAKVLGVVLDAVEAKGRDGYYYYYYYQGAERSRNSLV